MRYLMLTRMQASSERENKQTNKQNKQTNNNNKNPRECGLNFLAIYCMIKAFSLARRRGLSSDSLVSSPLSMNGCFRLSSRLCPFTTGCSPPSMSSIVVCLLLYGSRWFPPSLLCRLTIFCLVVFWSLPSPWLPLFAAFGPPIVLHSCYMTGPSPLLFQCVSLRDLRCTATFIGETGVSI